jgi:anti-sigma-K factor RskA
VDRELTRAELDELLPLYALDALDGEERAQVTRYVERDDVARGEVESLRETASFLPRPDVHAPASVWSGIANALDVPDEPVEAPPLRLLSSSESRESRRSRRVVAILAAAAVVLAVVLGVEVVRQQSRIDDLDAEMHRDPMEQQAMIARASSNAHVIALDSMNGGAGAEVVMLPDGTGYLMGRELPSLGDGSTYQLWAKVGEGSDARMVSLGVLGKDPGISPFRLTATPTMFEVTKEASTGSDVPAGAVVLRGRAV